jgi:hypothetical protein
MQSKSILRPASSSVPLANVKPKAQPVPACSPYKSAVDKVWILSLRNRWQFLGCKKIKTWVWSYLSVFTVLGSELETAADEPSWAKTVFYIFRKLLKQQTKPRICHGGYMWLTKSFSRTHTHNNNKKIATITKTRMPTQYLRYTKKTFLLFMWTRKPIFYLTTLCIGHERVAQQ